jgi:hypothetical protein
MVPKTLFCAMLPGLMSSPSRSLIKATLIIENQIVPLDSERNQPRTYDFRKHISVRTLAWDPSGESGDTKKCKSNQTHAC